MEFEEDLYGCPWEVSAFGGTSGYGRRRRAVLSIADGDSTVTRELPIAVGRALERDRKAGRVGESVDARLTERLSTLLSTCSLERVKALVNRRDYTSLEVRRKLLGAGYPRDVAEATLGRSMELGLVDDARYGHVFARSKVLSGWGQRRIELELERRGVDPEDVRGWPEEFVDEAGSELERATEVAARRSFRGKDPYAQCMRFLLGRGFSYDISSAATRAVVCGESEG
ncbi:MAG: recombination regulator RecX [Olsenella sp.]|nr:recombination regulator RecX [Olsenella sp.]